MDKKYQDVLDWLNGDNEYTKDQIFVALKLEEAEKEAPTIRGKLKTEDFAVIIDQVIRGVPAKQLASKFGVSTARISEIKREKSIPRDALPSYLEAKIKATNETE